MMLSTSVAGMELVWCLRHTSHVPEASKQCPCGLLAPLCEGWHNGVPWSAIS